MHCWLEALLLTYHQMYVQFDRLSLSLLTSSQLQFLWLFKEQRLKVPHWRTQRPYLMAQKVWIYAFLDYRLVMLIEIMFSEIIYYICNVLALIKTEKKITLQY